MSQSEDINGQNETYILNEFLEWFNDDDEDYIKIGPDDFNAAPDAIIYDEGSDVTTWVEITTCFLDEQFAIDECTYARNPIENLATHSRQLINPDLAFAERFAKLVEKKFNKTSYESVADEYGEGILIIRIMNPFFDEQTEEYMREKYEELEESDYFDYVVICYHDDDELIFEEWASYVS